MDALAFQMLFAPVSALFPLRWYLCFMGQENPLNYIPKRGFHFLLLLLAFTGLLGCFSERNPKKPEENTNWISPTEPSILLENLKKSFSQLDVNNYRRCFLVEQFSFNADPTILANNLGVFSNWGWDNENQFFNNLNRLSKPINPANSLQFSNPRTLNISSDSLEYTADYEVAIYHQDTSFKSVNFAGLLSFQMKRNRQNEWQIVRWQDNKTRPTPCVSDLKQNFFAR